MAQSHLRDLETQFKILMLECKSNQVKIVGFVRRIDLCRFAQRVVCFLRATGLFVSSREQVVELRSLKTSCKQLFASPDCTVEVAGLCFRQDQIEADRVRIRVAGL